LPNCPLASQKIKVDNKARFRYQVGYWFRYLMPQYMGPQPKPIHNSQFSLG
jgi:hypothetical protein